MKYTKQIKYEIYHIIATKNPNIKALCYFTGIDRSTYYQWLKDKEGFDILVKYARAKYRREKRVALENALYRRALGYTITETSTITNNSGLKQKKVHIPPCYKSLVYILENFNTFANMSESELSYEIELKTEAKIEEDTEYQLEQEYEAKLKLESNQEIFREQYAENEIKDKLCIYNHEALYDNQDDYFINDELNIVKIL